MGCKKWDTESNRASLGGRIQDGLGISNLGDLFGCFSKDTREALDRFAKDVQEAFGCLNVKGVTNCVFY